MEIDLHPSTAQPPKHSTMRVLHLAKGFLFREMWSSGKDSELEKEKTAPRAFFLWGRKQMLMGSDF